VVGATPTCKVFPALQRFAPAGEGRGAGAAGFRWVAPGGPRPAPCSTRDGMRANRGFTLFELMVVLGILGVVTFLVVKAGRAARHNATMAQGAYELALRAGGLKARAMSDGVEYVLVVTDTDKPDACRVDEASCGQIVVLKAPDATFQAAFQAGYSPDPPVVGAEWVQDAGAEHTPRNSRFDLASTWKPPPPFDAVTAFDPSVLFTCSRARRCFAIRFRPDGEVLPIVPPNAPIPSGFAFVLRPVEAASGAAQSRAIFVSFPAGIVKTAAF
jgi:prepilin-type N-terminal cleavage/methylation domain-containing protein